MPAQRLLPVVMAALLAACSLPGGAAEEQPRAQAEEEGGAEPATDVVTGDPVADRGRGGARVALEDGTLVLERGDDTRTLWRLDPEEDGRLERARIRPGDHDEVTVLALLRTQEHYELRYLVVDGDGVDGPYGFPWRLQVDERLTPGGEAVPVPVWAPDGGAVAWLEGRADEVRLRTVGWIDEGSASNPADEATTYEMAEVPPDTRLVRWEGTADGGSALVGRSAEGRWRIRLEPGEGVMAQPAGDDPG